MVNYIFEVFLFLVLTPFLKVSPLPFVCFLLLFSIFFPQMFDALVVLFYSRAETLCLLVVFVRVFDDALHGWMIEMGHLGG